LVLCQYTKLTDAHIEPIFRGLETTDSFLFFIRHTQKFLTVSKWPLASSQQAHRSDLPINKKQHSQGTGFMPVPCVPLNSWLFLHELGID
jgi:hypothetical protein